MSKNLEIGTICVQKLLGKKEPGLKTALVHLCIANYHHFSMLIVAIFLPVNLWCEKDLLGGLGKLQSENAIREN